MKFRPVLLLAFVFLGIMTTSSCVKKYICHCSLAYSGAPGLPDTTYQEYDITDTKDNANSQCKTQSKVYYNNYIYTVETYYLY